jgi:hypothetical protein
VSAPFQADVSKADEFSKYQVLAASCGALKSRRVSKRDEHFI